MSSEFTPRTITTDPVTLIEGHSKITLQLDQSGRIAPPAQKATVPRNQWHNRGHQWHQRKLRERISVLAAAWRLEISTVSVSQREVRQAAFRRHRKLSQRRHEN